MRAALTLSARDGVRSRASLAAGGGCFRPHEHDGAMGRKKNPHTHTPAVAIAAKAERDNLFARDFVRLVSKKNLFFWKAPASFWVSHGQRGTRAEISIHYFFRFKL